MKRFFTVLAFACFCILGTGCEIPVSPSLAPPQPSDEIEQVVAQNPNPKIEAVANGLEKIVYWHGSSTNEYLLLYKIDPEKYTFSTEHTSSARSIANWQADLRTPALIVNGAYFHEDYSPSGMLIIDAQQIGSRVFDFDKSAILELEPLPNIIDTNTSPAPTDLRNALQSYPLLIKQGRAGIEKDSELLARRTFFGIDTDKDIYIGILPKSELSLFTLSRVLERMPINWATVINLDGGPSSGIAVANDEIHNSIFPVPNVIIVRNK